jgi:transposase
MWLVPGSKDGKKYTVDPVSGHCTCPDHQLRQARCKHLIAVALTVSKSVAITHETRLDGSVQVTHTETVTKAARVTYKRDWRAYDAAQTQEKDHFMELLGDLTSTLPNPTYTFGRPRLPLSDMAFSIVFKVYTGFSARRFECDLSQAHERGLISRMPSFPSVNNYLKDECLTPILKNFITMSALPLKSLEQDFAIDSSGFGTCRFIKWFDRKYGREIEAREWVKCHLMVGARTQIVTTVEIAGWETNDSPYFAPLVEATSQHFELGNVTADKGYLSRPNLQLVADKGGTPFIPFKSNTKVPTEDGSTWTRMYHYFSLNREAWLEQYHQRSTIESTFATIKAKFGDAVRGKSNTAQVNEVLCKVLCVVNKAMQDFGVEPNPVGG